MFSTMALRRVVLGVGVAAFALVAADAEARPGHALCGARGESRRLVLDHVVMLIRHGVRAPLPDEEPASLADQPWPAWSTAPSFLTPHGREGMRLLGAYDRARYAAAGLLPRAGCPSPGAVSIWTNSVERTIASGEALAEGWAPACGLRVDHRPPGQSDSLFAWAGPAIPGFNAMAAVAAINLQTGGADRIAAADAAAIGALEGVLGCDGAGRSRSCALSNQPGAVTVSADGRSVDVSGPIRPASGAAQVLMLQYLEGLPMDEVGWGRFRQDQFAEMSRLHALLFEIYSRPAYMAPRVARDLAKRLIVLLERAGPKPAVSIIVGHDDNIAAVTALLNAHFHLPGYGPDDPPIGGALILEVYRRGPCGPRFVRALMQAQTPEQLRTLERLDLANPPSLQPLRLTCRPDAAAGLCPLGAVVRGLSRKLGRP